FRFFQAEDGIRAATVTGVQTCALPIYRLDHLLLIRLVVDDEAFRVADGRRARRGRRNAQGFNVPPQHPHAKRVEGRDGWLGYGRSEERRVGKGCSGESSAYHLRNMLAT